MRIPAKIFTAVLCLLLGGMHLCAAQAAAPATASGNPDSDYPEQSCLSASRYVNEYFDFSFDIPAEAALQPRSLPASRNGNIEILELAGPPPDDAGISIIAIPTASGNPQDAKTYMREALDHELYVGVEELHGLTKASLSGRQFYYFETRRGIEQHVIFATVIGDYIVRTVLAAHDEKIVDKLDRAFEHVAFFAPGQYRDNVQSGCKPYDGPSISSHRLALLEADPPEKQINPGKVSGDFYENPTLAFSYRIPQGWVLKDHGIVQPAVERYRTREDMGSPPLGRTEKILMDACSRNLFSAWARPPGPDGQISYDNFGEVTVSALSLSCFPQMRFPTNSDDTAGFKQFVAQYALTHPIVDDMGSAKTFTQDGITILYLHGTVAFQVPGDELSRRLSLGMAITQRGNYVLTWFFAAPHDEELQALTNERAIFDPLPANASQPGGGVTDASVPAPKPESGAANTNAAGAANPATPSTNQSAGDSSSAAPSPEQAASTNSSDRPSLLRPGETMQTQQGNGPVIKKR